MKIKVELLTRSGEYELAKLDKPTIPQVIEMVEKDPSYINPRTDKRVTPVRVNGYFTDTEFIQVDQFMSSKTPKYAFYPSKQKNSKGEFEVVKNQYFLGFRKRDVEKELATSYSELVLE